MTKCTCGPHPITDLTAAYHRHSSNVDVATVQKQLLDACRSHGCFHGCISISPTDRNEISSLAKSIESIERDIESLFASVSEDERNGGMFVVPFPESSLTATFRGRIAESGDPIHPVPEPKLSWEYRRCCNSQQQSSDIDQCQSSPLHSKLLPEWTDALHSIATLVIELLGIPQDTVLQGGRCKCSHSHCVGPCNIDLLRVFRYDAVRSSSAEMMGSSPHSDWGTLTVVWQDTKGGLQTYCHACDAWSDVDASEKSSSSSSSMAYFFVHVGDFLSLATIPDDGVNKGVPVWQSPRHRVNCPSLKEESGDDGNGKRCRRSLVYFAYPPPGVSLGDARSFVVPISSSSLLNDGKLKDISENDEWPSVEIYDRYSLLCNQSHHPLPLPMPQGDDLGSTDRMMLDNEEDALSTHRRIRTMSLNRVIMDKWDQVQRMQPGKHAT